MSIILLAMKSALKNKVPEQISMIDDEIIRSATHSWGSRSQQYLYGHCADVTNAAYITTLTLHTEYVAVCALRPSFCIHHLYAGGKEYDIRMER